MTVSIIPFVKAAHTASLDDLFAEAQTFGRVGIYTATDGRIWTKIEFATISGIALKAENPFVATPGEALTVAIESARKIREQFK